MLPNSLQWLHNHPEPTIHLTLSAISPQSSLQNTHPCVPKPTSTPNTPNSESGPKALSLGPRWIQARNLDSKFPTMTASLRLIKTQLQ